MATAKTRVERNTFVKGLNTEAGPLTFPENTSKDEINFVLNKDGSRQRRLGIDYEENYQLVSTNKSSASLVASAFSSYLWKNVSNDSSISITVLQVGDSLYFFDATQETLSSNQIGAPIQIAVSSTDPFDFATVNGNLVVVGKQLNNPVLVKYNKTTKAFSTETIRIEVRDIWGVEDGLGVSERPATLSDAHKYNLLNQGWDTDKIDALKSSSVGLFPSNADVWIYGKNSNDDFDPALFAKQDFGTSEAPKGRFVIEAFARGAERNAATSLSTLPADEEKGNISCVAAYAGRLFYSGIEGDLVGGDKRSPRFSNAILFTQIVDSDEKVGYCYQKNDPTSEHIPDLLDTDGGIIFIDEAKEILRLVNKEDSVLVFASNGVWEIRGGPDGFTPTSIRVRKVTDVGAIGKWSIVSVDTAIMYWSKGGIYQLVPDPRSGRLVAQNVSEQTIQKLYADISSVAKRNAIGVFDAPSRRVKWFYNADSTFDASSSIANANKVVVLDLLLGAFYIEDIKEITNGPVVVCPVEGEDFVNVDATFNVVSGSDNVVYSSGNVVTTRQVRGRGDSVIRLATIIPDNTNSKLTFSVYKDDSFTDWKTYDGTGVDAKAYLLTGEELFGDTTRSKQIVYLHVHMKRTETGFVESGNGLIPKNPSGCLVSARWDFSDSANSGKWSEPIQAYRLTRNYIPSGKGDPFDYGYAVITTKNKLRGSGQALSLYFETEPGKDCYLYGWALSIEGVTVE